MRFDLASTVRNALEDVVEALWPAACRACSTGLPASGRSPRGSRPYRALHDGTLRRRVLGSWSLPLRLLCPSCTTALVRVRGGCAAPGETPVASPFAPSPALFELVHALKYEGMVELAPWFAAFLAASARRAFGRDIVLVPVPLHPQREAERGFNQSALLAREAARRLACPLAEALLVRRRATSSQARQDAAARHANVAGAFARVGPPAAVRARLVLVDDVVTTGATVRAALDALGPAPGGLGILALCVAHRTGAVGSAAIPAAAYPSPGGV